MNKVDAAMIRMARECEAKMPQDVELINSARNYFRTNKPRTIHANQNHYLVFLNAVFVLDARGRHFSDSDLYTYAVNI